MYTYGDFSITQINSLTENLINLTKDKKDQSVSENINTLCKNLLMSNHPQVGREEVIRLREALHLLEGNIKSEIDTKLKKISSQGFKSCYGSITEQNWTDFWGTYDEIIDLFPQNVQDPGLFSFISILLNFQMQCGDRYYNSAKEALKKIISETPEDDRKKTLNDVTTLIQGIHDQGKTEILKMLAEMAKDERNHILPLASLFATPKSRRIAGGEVGVIDLLKAIQMIEDKEKEDLLEMVHSIVVLVTPQKKKENGKFVEIGYDGSGIANIITAVKNMEKDTRKDNIEKVRARIDTYTSLSEILDILKAVQFAK